ncbi:MAG: sugar transferase [Planctomycetales bacterium]|nr:sugar transferase [Planctomycetales bacterium]
MAKRLFDVVAASVGAIALAPVMLCAAIAVRLTSSGPVFFHQERMGRGFRPFRIHKFRTMVADAPARGGELTAGADPRITPVGRFLRWTKIDELPQLINVIKGEMSLVGPRPEVRRYVEQYRQDFSELLSVRPGVTGVASIMFRDESRLLAEADDAEQAYVQHVLPEKIRLEKEYLQRASFCFDQQLIWKTLWTVARG